MGLDGDDDCYMVRDGVAKCSAMQKCNRWNKIDARACLRKALYDPGRGNDWIQNFQDP